MGEILLIPIAIIYLLVIGSLFAYGVNFFYLTAIAIRNKDVPLLEPTFFREWPMVTVQLPIFNERYVAERLIEAVARIDYPKDRLEIQILDDSTDETVRIVSNAVERIKNLGIDIVHLHRTHREGFKAGALKDGLELACGEFIAIFDADFLPTRDFLKKTIPHFQDTKIAFVQGRWSHLNRNFSFLTFLQSLSIDAHFMVEQFARSRAGFWFNFNGTAGIWRKEAIEDAGGWMSNTLTEDLDLSYRAFLRGWKANYLRDLLVPAELPATFNAFRRQQHRWAQGSLECALKLLPQVWSSRMPLAVKLESTFHLTGYGVHLLLFALCLLYPIVIQLSLQFPPLSTLFGIAIVFNITALAPTMFFITAQNHLGEKWWRLLPVLLFISAFGAGMMVNTVRAALQIVWHKSKEFERTPKFGITVKGLMRNKRDYLLKLDSIVYWEILFAFVNLFTVSLGIIRNNPIIAFYAALFGFGLLFTSIYTIIQTLDLNRKGSQNELALEL